MPTPKSTITLTWFESVWNNGQTDSIKDLLSEDVIVHNLIEGEDNIGIPAFKKFYNEFRQTFSNIHVTVEEVVSQENYEAGLCTVSAKHNETGKYVQFGGISMIRHENGKIIEGWNHFDFLKMYQQLGFELSQKSAALR